MPRFSLRRLLTSTALVTIGLGCLCWAIRVYPCPRLPWAVIMRIRGVAWFVGFTMTGVGALMPFRAARLGFVLGLVAAIIGLWFAQGQLNS